MVIEFLIVCKISVPLHGYTFFTLLPILFPSFLFAVPVIQCAEDKLWHTEGYTVMKDIEYILDFAMHLGSSMLVSGANLERANDTMTRVCRSYHLSDISIFSLNSIIQISARSEEDDYTIRQISVPASDLYLERLAALNELSRKVCNETPHPAALHGMLREAERCEGYPQWAILAGRIFAMGGICVLFGGTMGDVIASDLIVFALYWVLAAFSRSNINNVIKNMLCMMFAGLSAHGLMYFGIGTQYDVICVTCSMMLVPGIALVNAARNLLCGNEMNGILEAIKAFIETVAIVMGLGITMAVFGGNF